MRLVRALGAVALAAALGQPILALRAEPGWTAAERAQVLALGPWPPAPVVDAGNPVSGRPEAVAFGEALFHSTRLSRVNGLRCASCHEPWRQFTDGRPTGLGAETGDRNTPTLLNVAQLRRFGWQGANAQLWVQNLRPLLDAREMRSDAGFVAAQLRADEHLRAMYAQGFGHDASADDTELMTDAAKAMAAYEETLVSERTAFDRFRDAMAAGDAHAAADYPAAAQRGLRLFIGRAQCIACHAGPVFSDSLLHATPAGAFRTPPLRELAATAPYLHDGRVMNLCDALQPHARQTEAAPPALTRDERRDLVAFLLSLSASGIPSHVDRATFDCR